MKLIFIKIFTKHIYMNRQEKYHGNRADTMYIKKERKLIENHPEQSAEKRNKNQDQQQSALSPHFFSVNNHMNYSKQKEY